MMTLEDYYFSVVLHSKVSSFKNVTVGKLSFFFNLRDHGNEKGEN